MPQDPRLEALQNGLLHRIESYVPVRGRPAPPRPALIEAFRRYPRHLFLPRFRAWRLGPGNGPPSLFGDPERHGFGLVDKAAGSAALWRAGQVIAYGDESARDLLFSHLARWTAQGEPTGYAFGLGITAARGASPVSHHSYRERRGPLDFWWWLRPSTERL